MSCSPLQIGIDLFLFGPRYNDVATLSGCSRFTSGSVFYYPSFSGQRPEDANKFMTELGQVLSRAIGLEAVVRVRASRGIKLTAFHGNFFLRSTDLMSVASVTPDNCFGIEMSVTENMNASLACFQTALLYTSSDGEFFFVIFFVFLLFLLKHSCRRKKDKSINIRNSSHKPHE